MTNLPRLIAREPLWLIGAAWPLVMLAPFVPGIPRPAPVGMWWRQEFALAALLTATLALLVRRASADSARTARAPRAERLLITFAALFVAWSAASVFWAENPVAALHHTLVWGGYVLFFLLMRRAARRPRLLRAGLLALAAVVWTFGVASTAEFWTASAMQYWGDQSLLFRNSIGLGEPLAAAVPLFAALALGLRRRGAAAWCGATAVVAWLVVLQTLERAPFIAATAGLFVLALAALTTRQFRRRGPLRACVLLAAFAGATALQTLPSFSERQTTVIERLNPTTAAGAEAKTSSNARLLLWGAGLEMWRSHPVKGVGAGNYEAAYPEARAAFAAGRADSPLVGLNEDRLVQRAHNEYVQMLAELGAVGLGLFAAFCAALVWLAGRAVRVARQAPLVPGAVAAMFTFLLSSGATSMSYRWLGSGLMFFFAAALVARFAEAERGDEPEAEAVGLAPVASLFGARAQSVCALTFALFMFACMGAQGANVALHGAAQASATREQAERLFGGALRWNPYDASTNFNYGLHLYASGEEGSAGKAVPHLRYAVERGFNASESYAHLAAAEAAAGDLAAAERTLAHAARVYPRSVFLHVRRAVALAELGRAAESGEEYRAAVSLDPRAARGWWHLITSGRKGALRAAHDDPDIPLAGGLYPENCVHFAIAEHERRPPNVSALGEDLLRAARR